MTKVRVAVVPAAGLGTRMMPATKAVPKELLPVGGKPAIDWILEEACAAGIEEVVVVSSTRKAAMDAYVSSWRPETGEDRSFAAALGCYPAPQVRVVYQDEPLGLGDAVRVGRRAVPGEPVAVLLPDELMLGGSAPLACMLEHYERLGRSVVALMDVPREEISSYGCVEIAGRGPENTLVVKGCVEKPEPAEAPSTYAICGRYVLGEDVLGPLEDAEPTVKDEVQLTSGLEAAARAAGLTGLEILRRDARVDIGNWPGWLAANERIFAARSRSARPMPESWRRQLDSVPSLAS